MLRFSALLSCAWAANAPTTTASAKISFDFPMCLSFGFRSFAHDAWPCVCAPCAFRARAFSARSRSPRLPGRSRAACDPPGCAFSPGASRSEEHTSELQSLRHLVCRLLLEKKKKKEQITAEYREVMCV